jgi:hypothetical protein
MVALAEPRTWSNSKPTSPSLRSSRPRSLRTPYPRFARARSGLRFYFPEISRWLSRDPLGELGGVHLYGFVHNSPAYHFDPIGLRCKIVVLFGHGATTDDPENWLLSKSLEWEKKLDECDGLVLVGCETLAVRELLLEKLTGTALTEEETLQVMTKLGEVLVGGAWSGGFKQKGKKYWVDTFESVKTRIRKVMCSKDPGGCCCGEVYVSFFCQNKRNILLDAKIITEQWIIPNFRKDIPQGETFCGKTWRWNCEGQYWEFVKPEWSQPW